MNRNGFRRKRPNLRHYSCIFLEVPRKTTRISVRIVGVKARYEPGVS
jgi:hypothetical protein